MASFFRKKKSEESASIRHKGNSTPECKEVTESDLFSGEWYLQQYPDVAKAGIDPAQHYLEVGAALGYDPGPDFSTRGYLSRYPDVGKVGMNPLLHYLRHGKAEGRVVVAPGEEENSGKRPYLNFAEFLRHSLLQPLIPAPFTSIDKGCFAFMERLSVDLADRALQIAEPEAPLVSIIMPAFDRESVIADAIESVLSQRYSKFELIVVDDGSSDATAAVASRYATDPRVRLERSPQRCGVSAARNRGLALARGELIAYLDTDNTWQPDYLAAMVGAFLQMPEVDAAYSGQYLYHPGEAEPVAVRFGAYNKSLLRNNNYIDLNCFMHRRSVLARIDGSFCETLSRLEDWDLALRISAACHLISVPVLQSNYFQNRAGNSISSTEPLTPALAIMMKHMAGLDVTSTCLPLQRPDIAVLILNCEDPQADNAAALARPDADILLLSPDWVLAPGALEALQSAAYSSPEVAITVPQLVLPAGHAESWRHVPYVFDALPCDISLSARDGNVEEVGLFHDGEQVELNFAPFSCLYLKREVWEECGGMDVSAAYAERVICEYIRQVLGRKILYIPGAVAHWSAPV